MFHAARSDVCQLILSTSHTLTKLVIGTGDLLSSQGSTLPYGWNSCIFSLGQVLPSCPLLRTLILHGQYSGWEGFYPLGVSPVEIVDAYDDADLSFYSLKQGLQKHASLTHLELRQMFLPPHRMSQIATGVLKLPLTTLDFSGCFLPESQSCFLMVHSGTACMSNWLHALLCGSARNIGQSNRSQLSRLDLSSVGMDSHGALELASCMHSLHSLQSINVCNNVIHGEGAARLATAVLTHMAVQEFCSIPVTRLKANDCFDLRLAGCGIGITGALVLAELVRNNWSLHTLDLQRNELCGIWETELPVPGLKHRVVRGQFDASGMIALGEALKVNTTLRSVNLSSNSMFGISFQKNAWTTAAGSCLFRCTPTSEEDSCLAFLGLVQGIYSNVGLHKIFLDSNSLVYAYLTLPTESESGLGKEADKRAAKCILNLAVAVSQHNSSRPLRRGQLRHFSMKKMFQPNTGPKADKAMEILKRVCNTNHIDLLIE
mmetsp:Transcript_10517/g.19877  ORF Transcript_10517/g.19877 Transcript_10517/m.19877 type:complete len:488 (-) Transcript_10517:69-1532(-)